MAGSRVLVRPGAVARWPWRSTTSEVVAPDEAEVVAAVVMAKPVVEDEV